MAQLLVDYKSCHAGGIFLLSSTVLVEKGFLLNDIFSTHNFGQ